ncbi:MAG: beta-lactamase family protein [Ruminiclostridium sp.]|nr:beta-lactamase family protein [Ruminiclostridium sp.]
MKNIKKIAAAATALTMLAASSLASAENAAAGNNAKATAVRSSDSEYIYCIASVSKVYVSAAVMQLADEGKIDIDKPVTEYIPGFRLADERYRDITVRMLMNHTSGLMGSTRRNSELYNDNDMYAHDNAVENLSSQRLKADPGKFAAYCNDGFELLEMIVENVSGMTYTEYIKENISDRLGLDMTGTAADMFGNEHIVPSIKADNVRLDTAYEMGFGTGGIFASASDNALFGTSFFTGDNTLLSESAKTEMSTRWTDKEYCDMNGLGWDYAEIPRYAEQGIKISGKGGDVSMDHAYLLTAPDEQISVSVLSCGGSSTYNDLIAQSLMDIALQEKGVTVSDIPETDCTTVTEIPQEYEKFAGWYVVNVMGMGDTLYNVSFPENRYMHIEETTYRRTTCTDYLFTTDGDFAELAYEVAESGADTRLAAGYSRISFEENADGTFLKMAAGIVYPGLGTFDVKNYAGQKIEENTVSDDVINGYKAVEGKALLLCGDKYSSTSYDSNGVTRLYVIDKLKGYVFVSASIGEYILKMSDAEHLTSFKNIPSSSSRDMFDITLEKDGNGIAALDLSNAQRYIIEDRIPVFDGSVKTVTITDDAAWFNISDSIANSSVAVTRPENSAVYVYNKFGEVIYTTHNKDARPQIPMPKGGKVLFLGERRCRFQISL